MKKNLLFLLLGGALLVGCDPKSESPGPATVPSTSNVFILNEGQFQAGDGAVSLFDKVTKVIKPDIFRSANNGAGLGDVVQSMGVQSNRGYVVVNGSNKIEVVSLPDFKSVTTINGLSQPRYFVSTTAAKGYVTEWRGPYTNYLPGRLTFLNLSTNTVATVGGTPLSVTVGRNPEQPVAAAGSIYVPNSLDNTVSVVDDELGTLTRTLPVGDGPQAVVEDKNGNLWVLCSGFVTYINTPPYVVQSSPGSLVRFSPATPTTQFKLTFPATGSPSGLHLNPARDQLYYSFGGAEYQLPITATVLPATPFIRRDLTGFGIDPRDNAIYGAVSPSYSSNGRFIRYQSTGAPIDSFEVKVGPNGFVFY